MEPLLKLDNITKTFGAVRALNGIDFELREREVLALIGDNGAGKSTLVKVIAGALIPDGGTIRFNGETVRIRNPEDARALGIETVYQDLSLFNQSDVAENIYSGREIVKRVCGIPVLDRRTMHARSAELLKSLKIHIQSTRLTVKGLSGGQRQTIAIARAVAFGRKIVILDEPTAALGVPEQEKVLSLIKELRAKDFSVILISHNLGHIFEVCDRMHVLHQGRTAGVLRREDSSPEEVVGLITGAKRAALH